MSNKISFRSNCPIGSALDLVGDKWSLLIIRDILLSGKQTFKELSQSDEKIASGILANRLAKLEELKIITKNNHPTNRKVYLYRLTKKGLDFLPVLAEFILWSDKYLHEHISEKSRQFAIQLKINKLAVIAHIIDSYEGSN